ncbi:MAG: hypothetical protein IKD04_04680 [Clostridia bacterium]|nr:hypothetical protein [Clostridia bacterium]
MILVGLLILIIVAVLSHIVLIKGTNFLGIIENKYREGIATELSSAEELKNKITETSSNIIKGATINPSEQVEVIGNIGTHLFYLEKGYVKCELIKYGFRISRIGRFLAWLKIVPKMKMANEINSIFENISGNKTNETENEKKIKSVSNISMLTNLLALISIVLIIFSVVSLKKGYVDVVKNSVPEGYNVTYGEAFADFFTDATWEGFNADDGRKVAEFKGTFLMDGENATVLMQYTMDDVNDTFELSYFTINGEIQDMETYALLMESVFEKKPKTDLETSSEEASSEEIFSDETMSEETPPEYVTSLSTPILSGFYSVNVSNGLDGQCYRTHWGGIENATGYEIESTQLTNDGSYTETKETTDLFYEVATSMPLIAKVRVRAYIDNENGKRIYSEWSEPKEVEINTEYLEENNDLNWDNMLGEYSGDGMNSIYLENNGNGFYITIGTYRGGEDLEGKLFLEENNTLCYSDGDTHSFSLRILDSNTVEIFDASWSCSFCGVYTKY